MDLVNEVFCNKSIPLIQRIKKTLTLLGDLNNSEGKIQIAIKDIIKHEPLKIFNVAIEALNYYNFEITEKNKKELNLSCLSEEALTIIQRLFQELPIPELNKKEDSKTSSEFSASKINSDVIYDIVKFICLPQMASKYKKSMFSILLNYMNFLYSSKRVISEKLLRTFVSALPYNEMKKEKGITCKRILSFDNDLVMEHWVEKLSKESGAGKISDQFNGYTEVIEKLINKDKEAFVFILKLIKYYWIPYLYPEIYVLHVKETTNEFGWVIVSPDTNPAEIGFHPYCPPQAHVMLYI